MEKLRLPNISEKEANFREYLRIARYDGIYLNPKFIEQGVLDDLRRDLAGLEYKPAEPHNPEKVVEKYFVPVEIPFPIEKKLDFIKGYFGRLIRQSSVVISDWYPNTISIQKYDQDSLISSHGDLPEDYGAVLILTVCGEAIFKARHEREGTPFFEEKVGPGDLVILRSTGLDPGRNEYAGVYHEVGPALTEAPRISIGFRDRRN